MNVKDAAAALLRRLNRTGSAWYLEGQRNRETREALIELLEILALSAPAVEQEHG